MDIHKPKPWHGRREFLKELGTIVLGVLIALGAEQAVEWLHREIEVRETREALADEIGLDLRNIAYSKVEDRCMDAHMAVWAQWARGGPKPQFSTGVFPPLAFAAWEVAKSGPLAHMPLRDRLAYTRFYSELETLQGVKDRDGQVRTNFTGYRAFDRLSSTQAEQVLPIIEADRVLLAYKRPIADRLLAQGKALGVKPAIVEPPMRANLVAMCRDVGLAVPG